MSDDKNKNKELAKRLVAINHEDRRQMQYMFIKEWDVGLITGVEAIEKILDTEKIIHIDINTLRRARNGKPKKKDK